MSIKFTSTIKKEGKYYVATCVELGVVSQGKTLDEASNNLKEAVELYLENTKVSRSQLSQYNYISTFEVAL